MDVGRKARHGRGRDEGDVELRGPDLHRVRARRSTLGKRNAEITPFAADPKTHSGIIKGVSVRLLYTPLI